MVEIKHLSENNQTDFRIRMNFVNGIDKIVGDFKSAAVSIVSRERIPPSHHAIGVIDDKHNRGRSTAVNNTLDYPGRIACVNFR